MLPITNEVLVEELNVAESILRKWREQIAAGIPGVDTPASEEALEDFVRKLCGELMVVAGKCETLASVTGGGEI